MAKARINLAWLFIVLFLTLIPGCLTSIPGCPSRPTLGNTFYVDDNGEGCPEVDFTTIQEAINSAATGDKIIVCPGTYNENITVNKTLTIESKNGADSTTIQAADSQEDVVRITANYVEINGFTIKEATGQDKNGINIVQNVSNCEIINNTVINNYRGILVYGHYNTIRDNNANSNSGGAGGGIAVLYSDHNTIDGNTANSNMTAGIALSCECYDNTVTDNHCSNNLGCGIYLGVSSRNEIASNNVDLNIEGIYLGASSDNTVENNNCSNNNVNIYLTTNSNNNTIDNNSFSNSNFGYGIKLQDVSGNHIYLNDFISNRPSNHDCSSSDNTWHSPSQITYNYNGQSYSNYLGNYWDDYTGNDSNQNGIGDSSYQIGGDNNDDYPLMEQSGNY